jgi:hypothetical protein
MNTEEFFSKTDKEIARAIAEGRKYFYLISTVLPCTIEEFESHYFYLRVEARPCHKCNPPKYDIILNL